MRLLAAFFMLMLVGCDEKRLPAPTAEESERLDQAGAKLDNLANETR